MTYMYMYKPKKILETVTVIILTVFKKKKMYKAFKLNRVFLFCCIINYVFFQASEKLVLVMVGLPARGKTYVARKLRR